LDYIIAFLPLVGFVPIYITNVRYVTKKKLHLVNIKILMK
jgi:hypothetical protein